MTESQAEISPYREPGRELSPIEPRKWNVNIGASNLRLVAIPSASTLLLFCILYAVAEWVGLSSGIVFLCVGLGIALRAGRGVPLRLSEDRLTLNLVVWRVHIPRGEVKAVSRRVRARGSAIHGRTKGFISLPDIALVIQRKTGRPLVLRGSEAVLLEIEETVRSWAGVD